MPPFRTALLFAGVVALLAGAAQSAPSPTTAPDTASAQAILAQCKDKEEFADPAPPAHLFGNVWYVGTCNITVLLVTSPRGHVLIDTGPQDATASVTANIVRLGFRLHDVRWIVSSHEHFDHVGSLAAMERLTGARFAARAPAAAVIRRGKAAADDSQFTDLKDFPGARVDRILADGDTVAVGDLRVTAFATPGHTDGSTSWTWTSCERADCRRITYVDSLSALAAGPYRFTDHPAHVAEFRRTLDAVAHLACGVLVTPHPSSSALFERMSGAEPFMRDDDCRKLAETARQRLDTRLASEALPRP